MLQDGRKKNQQEYYKVINDCNNAGNSNVFIEFMLKMINETIDKIVIEQNTTQETTQEKIIELIKENPNITQVEMAEKLGVTRDGISYNIKVLKENGMIEKIGSTKNGSWNILNK